MKKPFVVRKTGPSEYGVEVIGFKRGTCGYLHQNTVSIGCLTMIASSAGAKDAKAEIQRLADGLNAAWEAFHNGTLVPHSKRNKFEKVIIDQPRTS